VVTLFHLGPHFGGTFKDAINIKFLKRKSLEWSFSCAAWCLDPVRSTCALCLLRVLGRQFQAILGPAAFIDGAHTLQFLLYIVIFPSVTNSAVAPIYSRMIGLSCTCCHRLCDGHRKVYLGVSPCTSRPSVCYVSWLTQMFGAVLLLLMIP